MSWREIKGKFDWTIFCAIVSGIAIGFASCSIIKLHKEEEFEAKLIQKENDIDDLTKTNHELLQKFNNAKNDSTSLLNELAACSESIDQCENNNECVSDLLFMSIDDSTINRINNVYKKVKMIGLWDNSVEKDTAFKLFIESRPRANVITINRLRENMSIEKFTSSLSILGECKIYGNDECYIEARDLTPYAQDLIKKRVFN